MTDVRNTQVTLTYLHKVRLGLKTLREHLSSPIQDNFVLQVKGPIPLQMVAYLYPKTKIMKIGSPIYP